MSINAIIDGTTYEGIETIVVGGKTILLSEVEDEETYPTISFFKGANTNVYSDGQIVNYGSSGIPQAIGDNAARAFAYVSEPVNGGTRITTPTGTGAVTNFPSNAYPMPIPDGATKLSISCTGLLVATTIVKENGDGTELRLGNTGGWSEVGGFANFDLTEMLAQGATHIMPGFKNSSDTTLANTTIDSTTVQITFS